MWRSSQVTEVHLEDIETLIGKSETVEKRKRNQAVKNPKENKACDRWSS